MAGGLRYETGHDMPPGMLEKAAVKIARQMEAVAPAPVPEEQPAKENIPDQPSKARLIDAEAAKTLIKNFGKGAIEDGQKTLDPADDIILLASGVDLIPSVEAIPIAVIKMAIDGVNAADQADQAGIYSYKLRDALRTVLEWYGSPSYKGYERRCK